MTLFFTLLPLYIFGNVHCLGMCGPLVMMLSQHRFRYFYFFGRLLSFTLAGVAAGSAGFLFQLVLKEYHIPAAASFLFGGLLLLLGMKSLCGFRIPGTQLLGKRAAYATQSLSLLLLRDQPLATFLFGFFTLLLPCGQTIIVYSACALAGDPMVGLLNGFAFALITSPSLFLAMQLRTLIPQAQNYYQTVAGVCAMAVACLAFCRGLAELEVIPHLVLNPNFDASYHLILY